MSDLAEKILDHIAEREHLAGTENQDGRSPASSWHTRSCGYSQAQWGRPCICGVPAEILRDCAADREIVAEVQSWKHYYCEDSWYSCGLAVEPYGGDGEPGSGCANDDNIGQCTCDFEDRRLKILEPLARGYGVQP